MPGVPRGHLLLPGAAKSLHRRYAGRGPVRTGKSRSVAADVASNRHLQQVDGRLVAARLLCFRFR